MIWMDVDIALMLALRPCTALVRNMRHNCLAWLTCLSSCQGVKIQGGEC